MSVVDRGAELAANLSAVRERIERACGLAGRSPDEVTLVAVTKTHPVDDVRLLLDLGVHDFGENRDQDAAAKAEALADARARWHFVGQLQTNKCRSVVRYASVVESVDRPRLADVLDTEARRVGRTLDVLVQVSLDEAAGGGRGGAAPGELLTLGHHIAGLGGLRLAGAMAVAPPYGDPRAAFERLADLAAALRAEHPSAGVLSAGMSGDLEAAIAAGSTHVRVGTALLGRRSPPVG